MKKYPLIVAVLMGCAQSALAELPKTLPVSSVTMEVKSSAARKSTNEAFRTDYGSYDKRIAQEKTIVISLRNTGRAAVPVVVRTYWIGKSLVGSAQSLIKVSTQKSAVNPAQGLE